MTVDVQAILRRADALFSSPERSNNEMLWDELAQFMLNNQYQFFKVNSASQTDLSNLISSSAGAKKTRNVYDSTALQATQDLASAFQGTLTNPATVWSELRFQNDELNDNEEAVSWLQAVNRKIHNEFNESNFDTEIAKSYQSFTALANMALMHEELDNAGAFGGFRFEALHLSQVAWAEDKHGQVDTVYRRFTLTAKQAFDRWGADAGENVLKALEKQPDKEFDFIHAIQPNKPENIKLNAEGLAPAENRPFISIYVGADKKVPVEVGGYYEFPVYAVRWGTMPGEKYGRGPGHLALPDTRTINRLKQRALEAIDLQVRPPILANQRDVFGQLDMRPGGISIVRDIQGIKEFVSQARMDVMQFSAEELRASIRSIFFLDKIQPLATLDKKERMSQLEVTKRLEEMQSVLGPTLSRLNSELLQPLIVRAFKILLRSGELPEMPAILQELGVEVDIVFVNQLARSQQIQDVSNIQQWVQNLGMLAQINPEVVDNIDVDGIARHTAKILGVPEEAVKGADRVAEVRQQRAQQQAQMQQMEMANMAADSASKLGIGTEE